MNLAQTAEIADAAAEILQNQDGTVIIACVAMMAFVAITWIYARQDDDRA